MKREELINPGRVKPRILESRLFIVALDRLTPASHTALDKSHTPLSTLHGGPYTVAMSDSSSQSSLDAQLLPEQPVHQWLPVPTPGHNLSRTSFTLSETNSSFGRSESDSAEPNALSLPPDVAGAQLSIAGMFYITFIHLLFSISFLSCTADGTFVETTSAGAARELKRRYDQLLGVGKDGVRSPYTITSIVNQVGTRVFRVWYVILAPQPICTVSLAIFFVATVIRIAKFRAQIHARIASRPLRRKRFSGGRT